MTVRRTHTYSDTWEQFIEGVYGIHFGARNVRVELLAKQLGWDEKIAMIVALSKDWTGAQRVNSFEVRRQQRAAAAAESARLTPRPDAFVAYVSEDTKSIMPTPGVKLRDRQTRRKSMENASRYFRLLDRSSGQRIGRIIRKDLRLSPQQWARRAHAARDLGCRSGQDRATVFRTFNTDL